MLMKGGWEREGIKRRGKDEQSYGGEGERLGRECEVPSECGVVRRKGRSKQWEIDRCNLPTGVRCLWWYNVSNRGLDRFSLGGSNSRVRVE